MTLTPSQRALEAAARLIGCTSYAEVERAGLTYEQDDLFQRAVDAFSAFERQVLEGAAEHVMSALACSICLEIDVCKCDFDVAVSAGPCQPPTDKLADSIRMLAP